MLLNSSVKKYVLVKRGVDGTVRKDVNIHIVPSQLIYFAPNIANNRCL